ncbi:probable transcriptional regulator [Oceanobacter sp. RED65]|uniref:Probable transcriptional regulator n=2 Tax=Bermanella marisrubri TaxID=207949 RepID=Q1N5S5_9GAMM|nr:probable transcriptional regulator [Oceanobacter sp. RED65] [Bermanella marisrubri]
MDIRLAQTFLEIMSSGSFLVAAKTLHISQTAATARIKNLEEQLGTQLFIRNRNGAKLTSDGERFVEHARRLVNTWKEAQAALAHPAEEPQTVTIGVESSLWNPIATDMVNQLYLQKSNLKMHVEVAESEALHRYLHDQTLDVLILHSPQYHSQLEVELLLEEKLIHVASSKRFEPNLFINWGNDFLQKFDASLTTPKQTGLSCNLGPLALKIMLETGGNGYFRTRVVKPYLDTGELYKVSDTQEFSYPIFITRNKNNSNPILPEVLNATRAITQEQTEWLI